MGGAVKTVWKGLPAWPLMGALGTVVLLNGLAWGLLLALRRLDAALLGIGALAYFFSLRHAFDADHIAAIDNVTRKLRQDGRRPVGVGLYPHPDRSCVVAARVTGRLPSTPMCSICWNSGGSWPASFVLSTDASTIVGRCIPWVSCLD